jgi:hypothetical protein
MRLLDPRFRYIPAARTDVSVTWRRFGFRPTTESERRARQRGDAVHAAAEDARGEITLALPAAKPPRRPNPSLKLAR